MLAVCNHSYFTYEKKNERLELVREIAEYWGVPVAYVNPVGVGDIGHRQGPVYRKDGGSGSRGQCSLYSTTPSSILAGPV